MRRTIIALVLAAGQASWAGAQHVPAELVNEPINAGTSFRGTIVFTEDQIAKLRADSDKRMTRARQLLRQGRPDEAIVVLREEDDGTNEESWLQLNSDDRVEKVIRGLCLYADGKYFQAHQLVSSVNPKSNDGAFDECDLDAALLKSLLMLRAQVYAPALHWARAALQAAPNTPLAAGLVKSIAKTGNYPQAPQQTIARHPRVADCQIEVWEGDEAADQPLAVVFTNGSGLFLGALVIEADLNAADGTRHYLLKLHDLDAPPLLFQDLGSTRPDTAKILELADQLHPETGSTRTFPEFKGYTVLRAEMEAIYWYSREVAPPAAWWARQAPDSALIVRRVEAPLRAAHALNWKRRDRQDVGPFGKSYFQLVGFSNAEAETPEQLAKLHGPLEHYHFLLTGYGDRPYSGSFTVTSEEPEPGTRVFSLESIVDGEREELHLFEELKLPDYERVARDLRQMLSAPDKNDPFSPAGRELLGQLKLPASVTIDAYLSPDLPARLQSHRETIVSLLKQLETRYAGTISVRIHADDPPTDEEIEEARKKDVKQLRFPKDENDDLKSEKAFFGIAMTSGAKKSGIPFVDRTLSAEYQLLHALEALGDRPRKTLGVVKTDAQILGGFDRQTMGLLPTWTFAAELQKQYELVEVDPERPIAGKVDALLVVQPSSLTPAGLGNLLAALRAGMPAVILEDPSPFHVPTIPGTSAPRPWVAGMFGFAGPPQPKCDLTELWKTLGVTFGGEQVVWQDYNPYSMLEWMPKEFVFVDEKSGAEPPFAPTEPGMFGLHRLVFPGPGFIEKSTESSWEFLPLVKTGRKTGTVAYSEIFLRDLGKTEFNPDRKRIPTSKSYVLAARIRDADRARGGLDVILAADVDLISLSFLDHCESYSLTDRGRDFEIDNLQFALNAVDSIMGDLRFVRMRPPVVAADATVAAAVGDAPLAETPRAGTGDPVTNSIGMKLSYVPAGSFYMGSRNEDDGNRNSVPRHLIRLSRPTYCGVHEVTYGQFAQFVAATGYRTDAERNGAGGWDYDLTSKDVTIPVRDPNYTWSEAGSGSRSDPDYPVTNVSFDDAVAFCKWLSLKEGKPYRLPTEAEWEYACRAGSVTRYQHGDDPAGLIQLGNVADAAFKAEANWPDGSAWCIEGDDGYVFAAPVGKFRPNAFGLHDMHGNAREWCADFYDENYYLSSPLIDPQGPVSGAYHVIRGGSWSDKVGRQTCFYRSHLAPTSCAADLGFRVVCLELPATEPQAPLAPRETSTPSREQALPSAEADDHLKVSDDRFAATFASLLARKAPAEPVNTAICFGGPCRDDDLDQLAKLPDDFQIVGISLGPFAGKKRPTEPEWAVSYKKLLEQANDKAGGACQIVDDVRKCLDTVDCDTVIFVGYLDAEEAWLDQHLAASVDSVVMLQRMAAISLQGGKDCYVLTSRADRVKWRPKLNEKIGRAGEENPVLLEKTTARMTYLGDGRPEGLAEFLDSVLSREPASRSFARLATGGMTESRER